MKKRYYIYAGYYEIYITDRILRRPLMFQSWHKSLAAAVRRAESYDETILYDLSIEGDVKEYFGELIPIRSFNGDRFSIRNGLTRITNEHIRCSPSGRPEGQDWWDIMQYLCCKLRLSLNAVSRLYGGKTYHELVPVLRRARKLQAA